MVSHSSGSSSTTLSLDSSLPLSGSTRESASHVSLACRKNVARMSLAHARVGDVRPVKVTLGPQWASRALRVAGVADLAPKPNQIDMQGMASLRSYRLLQLLLR